jgi:uncharacterized protein (TIGR03435 family)
MRFLVLVCAALAQAVVFGQADTRPRFEVASVKQSDSGARGRLSFPPGQAVLLHSRLKDVIPFAYGVQSLLVSGGPAWLGTEFCDIVGKMPFTEGAPPHQEQVLRALQVLLEERFQLKVHWEPKDMAVFKLRVTKEGFKLKDGEQLPEDTPLGFERRTASRIVRRGVRISSLVTALSAYIGYPVEDETGLTGSYSFVLEWQHEEDGNNSDFEMIAALRTQIGLNLEKGKGPVRTLVIDSAEKPGAN